MPDKAPASARARARCPTAAPSFPYDVYRDPGHTVPYTAATAVTGIAVPSAGNPFTLPIYGLVNKTNAVALPAGLYTDQLQVTLTF